MVTSYVEVGTKRTHTYTGWEFTDKNGQKHDLTPETVLYDYLSEGQTTLDVYAKHDTTFTIKFDLDGGTMTNMPADKVIKGESGTVDEPTEKPTKENWAFGGWINAATNADFVFTNPCTENTIIKAIAFTALLRSHRLLSAIKIYPVRIAATRRPPQIPEK